MSAGTASLSMPESQTICFVKRLNLTKRGIMDEKVDNEGDVNEKVTLEKRLGGVSAAVDQRVGGSNGTCPCGG